MSEPTEELQKAVVQKLLQSGPLMAIVQDRVFDDVPLSAGFPRITYGDEDMVADDFDCIVSNIVFLPIHVWSNSVGKIQCKQIAGMVRNILHEEELELPGFALLSLHHDTTRYLRDPDGKTNHGVITFRAMIDELPLVTEGDGDIEPVGPTPFLMLDAQNESYESDGAAIAIADAIENDVAWNGAEPHFVVGADGFTTLNCVLTPAFFTGLAAGFTCIMDMTGGPGFTGSANFNVGFFDLPGFNTQLQVNVTAAGVQVARYIGGVDTDGSISLVDAVRLKAAFVAIPGTGYKVFANGAATSLDAAVGTPGTAHTDICLFMRANQLVVHSLQFHEGALTDEECETLTSL